MIIPTKGNVIMNKKIKKIIISSVAVISALGIATGVFFGIFPMKPEVKLNFNGQRIKEHEKLVVASYNTAAPWGKLLEGTYTTRRAHLFAQQVNYYLPDILGVQEFNSNWQGMMEELLPQYAYYGVKRGGDGSEKTSEMSGIFYLKGKFDLVDSGTFWISETPEKESKYDDAACNRICSFVVLKNRSTGKLFAHFNTHLDHVSTEAQNLGGRLIAEKSEEIKAKHGDIPVVITGDFNQYPDGLAVKALKDKGFVNAYDLSENAKSTPTYHGWGKAEDDKPIDFILASGDVTLKNYAVKDEKWDNSYVSDHYMITAEIEL